jgi:hypothetical protein
LQIFRPWASPTDPPRDGEVLGKDVDLAPVNFPPAGDDAVAQGVLPVQAELRRPVGDERVQFHEGAGVQQDLQPFPRGQFPLSVLLLDPFRPSTRAGRFLHFLQTFQIRSHACPSRLKMNHQDTKTRRKKF